MSKPSDDIWRFIILFIIISTFLCLSWEWYVMERNEIKLEMVPFYILVGLYLTTPIINKGIK